MESFKKDDFKKNDYKNISPVEAKQRLEAEGGIILLDVRTASEYAEKHIPGSVLIPLDQLEKEAAIQIKNKETPIFVYCRSGGRSVLACKWLLSKGYTQLYNLGGIMDWPYETQTGLAK